MSIVSKGAFVYRNALARVHTHPCTKYLLTQTHARTHARARTHTQAREQERAKRGLAEEEAVLLKSHVTSSGLEMQMLRQTLAETHTQLEAKHKTVSDLSAQVPPPTSGPSTPGL